MGQRWLCYWHDEGPPHLPQFFRCQGCRALRTWRRIRQRRPCCEQSHVVVGARLTWLEKGRLLFFPWSV